MIHVCFVLRDERGCYSKFTGTTILSLFENLSSPRSITIHILHDNTLTSDNRDKFIQIAGRYNRIIKFYNVEKTFLNKIKQYVNLVPSIRDSRLTIGAFYKLLIPQIISPEIEKIIYLDSDIIVNLDISDLWKIELKDAPLGAVPELSNGVYPSKASMCCNDGFAAPEDYFNSGVLLMNLNFLRNEEDTLFAGIKFRGEHPEYKLFDQEILNYCFAAKALKLSLKFNCLVKERRRVGEINIEKKIYHYAGGTEAFVLDIEDPFNQLWMDYFFKTPWADVSIVSNLFKYMEEFGLARRELLIKFSEAMSGKIRVFVIDAKTNIKWLKKEYSIRDDEEIFVYDEDNSLQELINEMKISRNKKIFFVRIKEFIEPLKEAGFVENKDFFNHMVFFSPILLRKNYFYFLTKAM